MTIRKLLGASLALALLFSTPVPAAHADTYAPHSDFNGGSDGWDSDAVYEGLCVPALLCPAVVNSWSAGGADGNGYIRTQFGSLATTLAGTSTGVWQSPAFTYDGFKGSVPGAAKVDFNMSADVSALLGLALGNTTTFRVDLVDQATGLAVNAVPTTQILTDHGFATNPSAPVDPDLLELGHRYSIRITTSYNSVAAVVAAGEIGYDNVRLTAEASTGGGAVIYTSKELRNVTTHHVLPSTAKASGRMLALELRCPHKATPKACKIRAAGLKAGKFSKAATGRKIVVIRAGKTRIVKVKIKGKYVAAYKAASRIWLKAAVRVGPTQVIVRKRINLKR